MPERPSRTISAQSRSSQVHSQIVGCCRRFSGDCSVSSWTRSEANEASRSVMTPRAGGGSADVLVLRHLLQRAGSTRQRTSTFCRDCGAGRRAKSVIPPIVCHRLAVRHCFGLPWPKLGPKGHSVTVIAGKIVSFAGGYSLAEQVTIVAMGLFAADVAASRHACQSRCACGYSR